MHLAGLTLFPIKSLDGQAVAEAAVLPSGALEHDRAYALVDAAGTVITAKTTPAAHRLRSRLDLATQVLTVAAGDDAHRFHMGDDRDALRRWLGAFFGFGVDVVEDRVTGFPDDPDAPGPTLVSRATLDAVAAWFELPVANMRARLRANVEIDGVPAFWEDRLLGTGGRTVPFRIGGQVLSGVRACQRCAVPSRDPLTGEAGPSFGRRFGNQRRATLPDWAPREHFPHFYRACLNTRLPPGGQAAMLRLGDPLELPD